MIGWFLPNAAAVSYQQLLMERAFNGVTVADLMQEDVQTVVPHMSLQDFIDDKRLRGLIRREDILWWLSLYGDSTAGYPDEVERLP